MSTLSDLLPQIDAAFDTVQACVAAEADVRAAGAAAVADAEALLAAVRAEHGQRVDDAVTAASQARIALNKLRDQMNERVGSVTTNDARVSIR